MRICNVTPYSTSCASSLSGTNIFFNTLHPKSPICVPPFLQNPKVSVNYYKCPPYSRTLFHGASGKEPLDKHRHKTHRRTPT